MPLSVRHTRAARRDLREIWRYIGHDDEAAADRQLRRIAETLARLAEVPEMGRARPDLGDTIRSFPVGRLMLFYELTRDGLNVVRVLDSARDINPDLFEP